MIKEYDPEQSCVFNKVNEEWGVLSNMGNARGVVVNKIEIRNTEALYQACRFPDYPDIQQEIIEQKSGMGSKMKSKRYRKEGKTRSDWEDVKNDVMRYCLELKLYQHWEHLEPILLKTGDRPIVEQSHRDQYWGTTLQPDGKLMGENVLGEMWNDIKRHLDWYKTKPYHAISHFKLCGEAIGENLAETLEHELLVNPMLDGYIIGKMPWHRLKHLKMPEAFLKNYLNELTDVYNRV